MVLLRVMFVESKLTKFYFQRLLRVTVYSSDPSCPVAVFSLARDKVGKQCHRRTHDPECIAEGDVTTANNLRDGSHPVTDTCELFSAPGADAVRAPNTVSLFPLLSMSIFCKPESEI